MIFHYNGKTAAPSLKPDGAVVNEAHMGKITTGLLTCYHTVVTGLFAAILFLLCLFAGCSTSYITADASERTMFVSDHLSWNLAAVIGVLVLLVIVKRITPVHRICKSVNEDEEAFFKYRNMLLIGGGLIAVWWVLSTQYHIGADQAQVQKAVVLLHKQDYSMFEKDGYLAMFPNQLGLVWISYLFSFLFGSNNYIGFQLCNVVGLVVIYKELAEIGNHCGLSRMMQLIVIGLSIVFVPLTLYTSFVYGNLLGLACALAAISREMNYIKEKKKMDLILSGILIALSIQLKSNHLIFLIGMVIYGGMEWLKTKKKHVLLLPLVLIGCCLVSSMMVKNVTEHVTGYPVNAGASTWSWIAMGLQEGSRAPGWYNGYNSGSYIYSEYDPVIQEMVAKASIQRSFAMFSRDKWGSIEFFTKKIASQWNNPTFQGFWNVQVRESEVVQSQWLLHMTDAIGAHRWAGFLNVFQFLILSGAFLYAFAGRIDREKLQTSVPAMIFIGGFVFHLIWEAKCQYTISYFVLLIPYAVAGFYKMSEKLAALISNPRTIIKNQSLDHLLEKYFLVFIVVLLMVNLCIIAYGGGKWNYLKSDSVEYSRYLQTYDRGGEE